MQNTTIKLDIGCGKTPRAGYIGVDAFQYEFGNDANIIEAQMWNIPIDDGLVVEIYSSHALEHIPQKQVIPTLKEWKRLLHPKGIITLIVPDLIWVCANFLERHTDALPHQLDPLMFIFGNQEHDGEFHKTGFTPHWLRYYAIKAGLRINTIEYIWSHAQQSIKVVMIHE